MSCEKENPKIFSQIKVNSSIYVLQKNSPEQSAEFSLVSETDLLLWGFLDLDPRLNTQEAQSATSPFSYKHCRPWEE